MRKEAAICVNIFEILREIDEIPLRSTNYSDIISIYKEYNKV